MPGLQERHTLARFQQRFATEEACLDYLERGPSKVAAGPHCCVIGEPSRLATRPRARLCVDCHNRHYQVHGKELGKAIGAARVRTRRYQEVRSLE